MVQAQEGEAGEMLTLNASIAGDNHDADTKAGILSACGIEAGPDDAVNLNNLDDCRSSTPRSPAKVGIR